MIQICFNPIMTQRTGGDDSHSSAQSRYAVPGHRVLSKLLHVNREARSEALTFYRVRIPCTFTQSSPKQDRAACTTPGRDMLLFNPEYDVLQLIPFWPDHTLLADFLLNLSALDPRHVGLRNLAVDISHLPVPGPWKTPPPPPSAALRSLFAGLHEVFLITTTSLGRMPVPTRNQRGDRAVLLLNQSMPVRAASPAFSRLPRDPRPIAAGLRRVYAGAEERSFLAAWRALLARFGVAPGDVRARMSWLLAFEAARPKVDSRDVAEAFVRGKQDRWLGKGPGPSLADDLEVLVDQGLSSADLRAEDLRGADEVAFGYWLFPLDLSQTLAERSVKKEEEEDKWEFMHHWVTRSLHDLSEYWPELLLIDLA